MLRKRNQKKNQLNNRFVIRDKKAKSKKIDFAFFNENNYERVIAFNKMIVTKYENPIYDARTLVDLSTYQPSRKVSMDLDFVKNVEKYVTDATAYKILFILKRYSLNILMLLQKNGQVELLPRERKA